MTFKKILGLLALACLTIIGLSACTPEKEPTWTYDKNKMLFTGQDASVQVLSATKIESPEGQKAVRVHYKLSNSSKETMNAYTLLMKVVLDVKQEKEELKVATLVFSKDDDRDKIANKTKIAPKEVKEIVVDYAVADFDHDLSIDFSDYGTEANATAKLSKKLNKSYHHMNVWCFFIDLNLYPDSNENTILFNRQNFHKLILYLLTKEF